MAALLDALERDPTARRRRAWLAAAFVASCAALGGSYAHHRAALRARCDEGVAIIGRTWSAAARARVHDAIAQSGAPVAGDVADRVQRSGGPPRTAPPARRP
jgi:hypothetical protein